MSYGLRVAIAFAIMGVTLGLFSRRGVHLIKLLALGKPDPERLRWARMASNIKYHTAKVLFQKKLFQWSLPGLAHALTFWGFLVVQITLVETFGEIFQPTFHIPWLGRQEWLGFTQDLLMSLVVLALISFVIIRLVQNPHRLERKSRFFGSHMIAAYVILLMIFGVVATVEIVRSARWAVGTLPYPHWAFVAKFFGQRMTGYSHHTLRLLEDTAVLVHLAVVFGFLLLIGYSKHLHIFTSPLNVMFGRQPLALGALRPIHIDMETVSEDTVFGALKVEDFSWKQLLDGFTCTECGRCQSQCPAWNTGKPLNPKLVIMDIRDHLFAKGAAMFGATGEGETNEGVAELTKSLVPDVIADDVLWSCTTCGACVYECPVDIEHVDTILDMRRAQVMMESRFPAEAGNLLRNLENSGNPWAAPASDRLSWAKGIEDSLIIIEPGMRIPPDVEYLYWVGCVGALEERPKKSVRAFAELMIQAGVSFALLGQRETCTGDPARRMGNEYLFQELAKQNIATFEEIGVRKIVASCPHCFNTIAREYPDFGGSYKVIHHSELLAQLIEDGRLNPREPVEARVTYHDPCYLARHNDVMSQPRAVVESIPGITSTEMHRHKKKTFCCGAGGARLWMEETIGKRLNIERIDEALSTNPDIVSTGCPYCMIMLDDAVKDKVQQGEASEDVKVLDISQVLLRSTKPAPVPLPVFGGAPDDAAPEDDPT
ncbi:MAG: (Fe-S)-binding protein [Actinomycetota bacterium]|nr:(Fe-S)-binding protein [Actinomycetota bacterium]